MASRPAKAVVPGPRVPLGKLAWRDVRTAAHLARRTGAIFASVHGVELRFPPPPQSAVKERTRTSGCTARGNDSTGEAKAPGPCSDATHNARQRRSAARLADYREKRRCALAVADARHKIFACALRNLRVDRMRRVHAEWQRLEAAAAAAAAAVAEAAEQERLAAERRRQVRAYLRSLLWRAWSTGTADAEASMTATLHDGLPPPWGFRRKPEAALHDLDRCTLLPGGVAHRDLYIYVRAVRLCQRLGLGRGHKRRMSPPASAMPSPHRVFHSMWQLHPAGTYSMPKPPSTSASKKPKSLTFI